MGWLKRILLSRHYVPLMTVLTLVLLGIVTLEALASAGRWPPGGLSGSGSVLITGPGTGAGAPPMSAEVLGAVQAPGVYRLPEGDHVRDLVAAAGGFLQDADLTRVDLAAQVVDGQIVYVPHLGEQVPTYLGGKVDINTASAQQMHDALGITLATGLKIVAYRAAHGWFTAVSQLLLVPISRTIYDRIKDLVTV